jgi:hypothetical protein
MNILIKLMSIVSLVIAPYIHVGDNDHAAKIEKAPIVKAIVAKK